jgi:hypothetical protein
LLENPPFISIYRGFSIAMFDYRRVFELDQSMFVFSGLSSLTPHVGHPWSKHGFFSLSKGMVILPLG